MLMHSLSRALAVAGLLFAGGALAAPGDAHCTLPGELVTDDPADDSLSPAPGHDAAKVFISEMTSADGIDRIFITLTHNGLAQADTPQSIYQVKFMLDDGVDRFVRYVPYPLPAQADTVFANISLQFAFGHNEQGATGSTFTIDGPIDPLSTRNADGTITFVMTKDTLPFDDNAAITSIQGIAQMDIGAGTLNLDSAATLGTYIMHGNASCASTAK